MISNASANSSVVDVNSFAGHANVSDIRASNIPPTFEVEVKYRIPDRTLNLMDFYESTMLALLLESTKDFNGRSDGFFGEDRPETSIILVPVVGQEAQLRRCHVIWALQRVAEDLSIARQYKELHGKIKINPPPSPPSRDKVHIADYFLGSQRAMLTTLADGLDSDTTSWPFPSTSGRNSSRSIGWSLARGRDLRRILKSVRLDDTVHQIDAILNRVFLTWPLNNTPYLLNIKPLPNGRRLERMNAFLGVIRSIARLAEHDHNEPVREWHYNDRAVRIGCHMSTTADMPPDYGQIPIALTWMMEQMIEDEIFRELQGNLIYQDPQTKTRTAMATFEIRFY